MNRILALQQLSSIGSSIQLGDSGLSNDNCSCENCSSMSNATNFLGGCDNAAQMMVVVA